MNVEAYDEILSPQRCARCGAAFAPSPDKWVFCPQCHACHVGRRMPEGVHGATLLNEWMRSFAGLDFLHIGGGYAMHKRAGRLFLVHGADVIRGPGGFSVVLERGETDSIGGSAYRTLRLAGFASDPSRPLPESPMLDRIARPQRRDWGLVVEAVDSAAFALNALGEEAVPELCRVAEAAGLEPILESNETELAALPARVLGTLDRSERTIRCDGCGAPVAPEDLGAASSGCPYCATPVTVSETLARELEGYRRQLRAQDASHMLDGARLWDAWQAEGASADRLACAVCGAPSAHRPGAVDERCEHCAAMIIPSQQRLREDVGAARERRLAEAQRDQAERRSQYATAARGARRVMHLNVALWLGGGAMALCTPAGLLFSAGSSGQLGKGLLVVTIMTLSMGLPVLGVLLLLLGRARQRADWRPVWARLAEQLDGRVCASPDAWFAQHWASPVEPFRPWTGPGPASGAVEGVVDGVPFLIRGDVGEKWSFFGRYPRPSLRMFIAVDWSDATSILKAMPGVRERRRQLAAAGFGSCVRRRGLELSATPETVKRLRERPEQAAVVVPILFEALRVARLIGGRP